MPPNTPICSELMPKMLAVAPDNCGAPKSVIMAPMVACMMKNAITDERAATSFSCFAIPMDTPMAKIRGRLSNTTDPAALSTCRIAFANVPGPIHFISPYASSIVVLVKEPPIPRNNPAIGKIAMGSIKERPTLCNTPKILSFTFLLLLLIIPHGQGQPMQMNCQKHYLFAGQRHPLFLPELFPDF